MSSLYIHIPFCTRKCPYCDFFSRVGSPRELEEYVELLLLNLAVLAQNQAQPQPPLATIFWGGGTPSLLSVTQVERLLAAIDHRLGIAPDAEITLEANPGTVDPAKLTGYRRAGVNRLSLGIQSLDDQQLRWLGRIHSAAQARDSIIAARNAGFDNLSLDLMFGLPEQGPETIARDVAELLQFEPEHLSLYGLSIEAGTDFSLRHERGELSICAEDHYADLYTRLHNELTLAGYEHYEISNFARPGYRSLHNQRYWQRRGCFAIGCGAHGFDEANWGERRYIPADLERYRSLLHTAADPAELLETFDRSAAMKEFIYLALRTADGLSIAEFQRRFGQRPEETFAREYRKLERYLHRSAERWHFDPEGWLIYDHLISHFL